SAPSVPTPTSWPTRGPRTDSGYANFGRSDAFVGAEKFARVQLRSSRATGSLESDARRARRHRGDRRVDCLRTQRRYRQPGGRKPQDVQPCPAPASATGTAAAEAAPAAAAADEEGGGHSRKGRRAIADRRSAAEDSRALAASRRERR